MVSSTSQYATDDFKSCDPNAPDPIWESVERYRKICREKNALQEEILHELGKRGHEAELEAAKARMALAMMGMRRHETAAAADRGGCSTWGRGDYGQGERPAITDLDGPREDPIRNRDRASRGASPDRLSVDTSNLPPHSRVDGTPTPTAAMPLPTITPATLAPNVESSRLSADGSVFAKYNEMIAALRTRLPPITLSFIPREEIPWPLLPVDGVFPVAVSSTKQVELDEVAKFAAGYALWRDKPLGKTLNILLGHWVSMDKRLREARKAAGQSALGISAETSETLRWIVNVRGKLYSIVAEMDPSVFTTYEQLMGLLAQGGYQLTPLQAIPWPIIPGHGEKYPVPAPGSGIKHRQIGRFMRAYSTWKACSEADIYTRMLSEWKALHKSCIARDARSQQCIKGVVNYLTQYA